MAKLSKLEKKRRKEKEKSGGGGGGGGSFKFNSFASSSSSSIIFIGEWRIVLGEEPIRREERKGGVAEGDDEGESDRRRRFPAETAVSAAALAPCDGGVAFVGKVHHLRGYCCRR